MGWVIAVLIVVAVVGGFLYWLARIWPSQAS